MIPDAPDLDRFMRWIKEERLATTLLVLGRRFYFYSNEGNEPPHIRGRKGEAECKYWLTPDLYEIEEASPTT